VLVQQATVDKAVEQLKPLGGKMSPRASREEAVREKVDR
jgi:hypothetical protein